MSHQVSTEGGNVCKAEELLLRDGGGLYVRLDAKGKIAEVNKAFLQALGFTTEETREGCIAVLKSFFVGQSLDAYLGDDYKQLMTLGAEKEERRKSFVLKNRIDEKIVVVPVHANVQEVLDNTGNVVGMILSMTDNSETARREAEATNYAYEAHVARAKLEQEWMESADGRIILRSLKMSKVNNTLLKMLGCKKDDLEGKSLLRMPFLTEQSIEELRRVSRNKDIDTCELHLTGDEKDIWLRATFSRYCEDGKELVNISIQDISELKQLADTDKLTGLHNRHAFYRMFNTLWAQSERIQAHLSVLMLDIDFFKRINDDYGHAAGDECLRRVSEVLRQNTRTADTLCRFGGEEFAIILSDTDKEGAQIVAENLRKAVSEIAIQMENGNIVSPTISIGLAEKESSPSIDALMNCADKALYCAKETGRNKVVYDGEKVETNIYKKAKRGSARVLLKLSRWLAR